MVFFFYLFYLNLETIAVMDTTQIDRHVLLGSQLSGYQEWLCHFLNLEIFWMNSDHLLHYMEFSVLDYSTRKYHQMTISLIV